MRNSENVQEYKRWNIRANKLNDHSWAHYLHPGILRPQHFELDQLHTNDKMPSQHGLSSGSSRNSSLSSENEYLEFKCAEYNEDGSWDDEHSPTDSCSLTDMKHSVTDPNLQVNVNSAGINFENPKYSLQEEISGANTDNKNVPNNTENKKASSYKTAVYPVAGAIIGTVVGGPVGLLAGGLAGVVGGNAGFLNEGFKKDSKEDETAAFIDKGSPSRSKSLTDVSPKKVTTRSWFGLRSLKRNSDCRAYCLNIHQHGVFDV